MICCQCKSSYNYNQLNQNIDKLENKCEFCKHIKCQNCFELKKIINYVHINNKNLSIDYTNNNQNYNKKNKNYKCLNCFIL